MAQDNGAAAGKVVFNVTASVRYPAQDQEAELQRLRDEGAKAAAAWTAEFNRRIGNLASALRDSTSPDVNPDSEWTRCDVVEGVGWTVYHRDGKAYNVVITEAF